MKKSTRSTKKKKSKKLTFAMFQKDPDAIFFELERIKNDLLPWIVCSSDAILDLDVQATEPTDEDVHLTYAKMKATEFKKFRRILKQLDKLTNVQKSPPQKSDLIKKREKLVGELIECAETAGGLNPKVIKSACSFVNLVSLGSFQEYERFRKAFLRLKLVDRLSEHWGMLLADAEDLDL